MLLTDLFPWLAQSPYAAQNHLPRVGTTHNEIPPHQSLVEKMPPQSCLQANLMKTVSQESVFLDISRFTKFTKPTSTGTVTNHQAGSLGSLASSHSCCSVDGGYCITNTWCWVRELPSSYLC